MISDSSLFFVPPCICWWSCDHLQGYRSSDSDDYCMRCACGESDICTTRNWYRV